MGGAMTGRILFTGDTHVHSTYSDGRLDPADLLLLGAARGLDYIALADHNTTAGAQAAWELWRDGTIGPRPFLAQEISAEGRLHVLVFGLDRTLGAVKRDGLPGLLAQAAAAGGASVLAHPWSIQEQPRAKELVLDLIDAGLLHGIELASTALFYEELGRWRQALDWCEDICAARGLAACAGSDWHDHGQGCALGLGRTLFLGTSGDEREFVKAVRDGATVASFCGPILMEHGLSARIARELGHVPGAPWDGLLGRPEALRPVREAITSLAARIGEGSGSPPSPAAGLFAGGAYGAAGRLLNVGS